MIPRRDFIILLGSAATWPMAARAQQTAMPVIGLLSGVSLRGREHLIAAFKQGLSEIGYVEGRNVEIEYRFAGEQYERLTALAADLVHLQVAVIATPGSTPGARAAKAATNTIPIVFAVGSDPIQSGLVTSLNRPGGNATGINYLSTALAEKRLGLLRELLPRGSLVAVLINPNNFSSDAATKEVRAAAGLVGQEIDFLQAGNADEIDVAFATLIQRKARALLLINDSVLTGRRVQIVTLAARHAIPAIYSSREFAEVGGLMSYGPNLTDVFRQTGTYTGRILKGEKPADLPVERPTKFEFVLNLRTAKTIGFEIPPAVLAIADEVIE